MPDEVLEQLLKNIEEDINKLLDDPSTSTKELVRGLIRVQRAMLPFFSQVSENTKRLDDIYPAYKSALWIVGVIVVANVGILVSLLTHTINLNP